MDRLHSTASPTPTPGASSIHTPIPSPPHIPHTSSSQSITNSKAAINIPSLTLESSLYNSHTPLVSPSRNESRSPRRTRSFSYGATEDRNDNVLQPDTYFFEGHHRHEVRSSHKCHHDRGPRKAVIYTSSTPIAVEDGCAVESVSRHEQSHPAETGASGHEDHGHDHRIKVGKKRQVVGILVST